jgi:DNA-binding CsgD family transcriptional regulator
MPVDPESLYARGLISDDRMDQLRQTMTHQAEGPNPAQPYLDAAKGFAGGGLKGAGVDVLPEWANRIGGVFQNPDNQAAMGMANRPSAQMLQAAKQYKNIFELVKKGKGFSEIADQLGLSKDYVKNALASDIAMPRPSEARLLPGYDISRNPGQAWKAKGRQVSSGAFEDTLPESQASDWIEENGALVRRKGGN